VRRIFFWMRHELTKSYKQRAHTLYLRLIGGE